MNEENEILYLRNNRPNKVVLWYGQGPGRLKFVFERRGTREDSQPLPPEAKRNPVVMRLIRKNILEEISEDQFVALADLHRPGHEERDPNEDVYQKQKTPDIPLGDYNEEIDMKMPYTIPAKLLDSKEFKDEHLSPKIEYVEEPLTTQEELAVKAKPAAKATPRTRAKKATT